MSPLRLNRQLCVRLGIVLLGLLIAVPGLYAWVHGYYWSTGFGHGYARWGTSTTLDFAFLGLLLVLFGLFSGGWDEITPEEEKKLRRHRWKKLRGWKR